MSAQYAFEDIVDYFPDHFMGKPSVVELDRDINRRPDVLIESDGFGYTPLHEACRRGHSYEIIELLVRHNPDVLQTVDKYGKVPLHHQVDGVFGCNYGDEELLSILKLMVDTEPMSIQVKSKKGKTPLHYAVYNNLSLPVIEYLVRSYPQALQIKDESGNTPLHEACLRHNDIQGDTLLHNACNVSNNLLVIQFLHTEFPLAARSKNNDGDIPVTLAYARAAQWKDSGNSVMPVIIYDSDLDIEYEYMPDSRSDNETMPNTGYNNYLVVMEYLAYECWPVACLMKYDFLLRCCFGSIAKNVVENATKEAGCALIDVAFHAKRILSDTVTRHIAQGIMLCLNKNSSSKSLTTLLSLDQYREMTLDESARVHLDCSTLWSIVTSEEIQCLLEYEYGHGELQELIDFVIRMNRAGRLYFMSDPENKQQGLKVLQAATGLSGFYFHIRENPLICKRC